MAGFEPATSCSQSRRDNRATLHPEKFCSRGESEVIRPRLHLIHGARLAKLRLFARFAISQTPLPAHFAAASPVYRSTNYWILNLRLSEVGFQFDWPLGRELQHLFFDARALTGQVSQVEYASPAHFAAFVNLYLLDAGQVERKDALYAKRTAHLTNRKGFGSALAPLLNDYTTKELGSGLVALPDLVVYRNGIAGLKFRKVLFLDESVLNVFE